MEFALVAPVFLTMLLGTMELARYYYIAESLRTLSAQTSRAAFIDSKAATITGCPASSSVLTTVNAWTPLLDINKVTLCITRGTDGVTPSHQTITVTANYPYATFLPLLSHLNATLHESTTYTY